VFTHIKNDDWLALFANIEKKNLKVYFIKKSKFHGHQFYSFCSNIFFMEIVITKSSKNLPVTVPNVF